MIYDPRIATVSEAEFNELVAILRRVDEPPRPRTDDDRWRETYAEEQRRRRIVGYQQDLFRNTTITHYRRGAAAPIVAHRPVEAVAAKLERIKGDPLAAFGPLRTDRPAILTDRQKKAMSCPLLSGPSTMTVWIKEGTTHACQEAQARGDHREAA